MEERPKITIELTGTDKIIEMSSWFLLVAVWVFTLMKYMELPDTIPVHYDSSGRVNDYGSKSTLLLLPAIGTIMAIGLSVLNRYPHVFNYPKKITPENALDQYTNATRMIRFLNLSTTLVIGIVVLMIVRDSSNETVQPGGGMIIMILVFTIIFLPLIYFTVKAFR